MKYKYSDDVNKELYKAIKNYNEKRGRDIKKRGRAIVPDKLYVKTIKERFAGKPVSEIKKEIKLISSYNKLGKSSLKKVNGTPLSQYERGYFEARIPDALNFYNAEIDELTRIIGKKPEYFIRHHERLNTLKAQRNTLERVSNTLDSLDESTIKSIRAYIGISQRSEITKERDYRTFLNQMDRAMNLLGYTKADIDAVYEKLYTLTPNEFMELYREEPIIEKLYEIIGSPDKKGEYDLMVTEVTARRRVNSFLNQLDSFIAQVKNHD